MDASHQRTRRPQATPLGERAPGTVFTVTLAILLLLAAALSVTTATGETPAPRKPMVLESPRVVVLKSQRRLHLFDGDRLIRSYPIDLGFAPRGQKIRRDDGRTPIGRFTIVSKNAQSPYHRFLGLSYPDETAVARGLAMGLISNGEAVSIRRALAEGRPPDWHTALGGGIGLHGHRRGRDWTGGCVALSDAHIEELFNVLRIGDPVEILP